MTIDGIEEVLDELSQCNSVWYVSPQGCIVKVDEKAYRVVNRVEVGKRIARWKEMNKE